MKNIKYKDFRHKDREDLQNFLWEKLLSKFSSAQSQKILNSLLSSYEKNIISRRFAVISLVQEGVSTKEIERLLWLSRATVSSIKKSFFGKASNYGSTRSFKPGNKAFSRIAKKDLYTQGDLFKGLDLLELLKSPPRPMGLGVTNRKFHA